MYRIKESVIYILYALMKQFPINVVCISNIHEDGSIMAET